MSGGVGEGFSFSNSSATTGAIRLKGGKYGLLVTATFSGGNIQLQTLSNDGSTWVNVGSSVTANNFSTLDLPPGQYRFAVTTATAVYIVISAIPY